MTTTPENIKQLEAALAAITALGTNPFDLFAYALVLDAKETQREATEEEAEDITLLDAIYIQEDVENDDPSTMNSLFKKAREIAIVLSTTEN